MFHSDLDVEAPGTRGGAEITSVYVPTSNKILLAYACDADGDEMDDCRYNFFDTSTGMIDTAAEKTLAKGWLDWGRAVSATYFKLDEES